MLIAAGSSCDEHGLRTTDHELRRVADMNPKLAAHYARLRHIRESFAEANERLVARLRRATDEAAHQAPADGGWTVAQIGCHVARVSNTFAGLISGERPGAQPLPPGFKEKEWPAIVERLP